MKLVYRMGDISIKIKASTAEQKSYKYRTKREIHSVVGTGELSKSVCYSAQKITGSYS